MASKEQELERRLDELKKAKNHLLGKIDECMRVNDTEKKKMWDSIAPFIKTAIQNKINSGEWNWVELKEIITDKALKAVCGEEVINHLDRL